MPWALLALLGLGVLLVTRRDSGYQGQDEEPEPEPSPSNLPRIVSEAFAELGRWIGLTETTAEGTQAVKGYWSEAGQSFPSIADPWSAVFVSAMANRAAPGALKLSQSHFGYATQAYQDRGKAGRYGAFQPAEVGPLQPGDIVIRNRAGAKSTFESLKIPGAFAPSHGDIVASVAPGAAVVIGGNVDQAVTSKRIPLTAGGRLNDPGVFAVLRFQA